MRNAILIILFTSFFTQSYSQDFGEIKLDSKLQVKYSDTIQNIGERITGKWKYLGKRTNGILTDTIGISFRNDKKTVITVENGIIIESEGNKRKKADYFYEITYNFKNGTGFYSREEKYINEDITSITSCQPIPELVYYKEKFGIVFIGMAGQSFSEINELTSEKLVLENGKEYLKIE
ncbi:MAG: hypothetical protein V3U92_16640 [Cellulophaga sp.]